MGYKVLDRVEVWNLLCRCGTHPHLELIDKPPKKKTEEDRIIDMYQAGQSIKAIAVQLHHDNRTITRILKGAGVEIKKPGGAWFEYKLDDREIIKLYEQGKSIKQLADIFGCSRRAIDRRLTMHGVQKRLPAHLRKGSA